MDYRDRKMKDIDALNTAVDHASDPYYLLDELQRKGEEESEK